jgi:hypothetical protein
MKVSDIVDVDIKYLAVGKISESKKLAEQKLSDQPESCHLLNGEVLHDECICHMVLLPTFPPSVHWRSGVYDPSSSLPGSTKKSRTRLCRFMIGVCKCPSTFWEVMRFCHERVLRDAFISKKEVIFR